MSSSDNLISHTAIQRAEVFAADLHTRYPILLGPMAGACPVGLSIAVAKGGGMGACGALLMEPADIIDGLKNSDLQPIARFSSIFGYLTNHLLGIANKNQILWSL